MVFEILSPHASRIDCVIQAGEYAALPSMRRHVIPGSTDVTATVLEHREPTEASRTMFLTGDDIPRLSEIRIARPVTAVREGTTLPEDGGAARPSYLGP